MNLETYLYDSKHEFTISLQCQGTPCVRVKINNQVKFDQKIDRDIIVDCTADLQKYDPGCISIEMYGKSSRDTIFRDGRIVKDTTLTIDDVIINRTSLKKVGQIHSGVYHPIYWDNYTGDKPDAIQGARTLGFNGAWIYSWNESPIRHIINQKELVMQTSINKDMHQIFDALDIR
jgi:hypothetical protein